MGSGGDLAGSWWADSVQLGTPGEPELHCVLFIIPDPYPEDGKGPITFKNSTEPIPEEMEIQNCFGAARCLPTGE